MKLKRVVIIIATVLCGLSLWSGVFRVNFIKNDTSGSSIILKIEKNSRGGLAIERSYTKTSEVVQKISQASFGRISRLPMMDRYNEQPVLYGLLLIFFGASVLISGFVIHMLRTDSRFQ